MHVKQRIREIFAGSIKTTKSIGNKTKKTIQSVFHITTNGGSSSKKKKKSKKKSHVLGIFETSSQLKLISNDEFLEEINNEDEETNEEITTHRSVHFSYPPPLLPSSPVPILFEELIVDVLQENDAVVVVNPFYDTEIEHEDEDDDESPITTRQKEMLSVSTPATAAAAVVTVDSFDLFSSSARNPNPNSTVGTSTSTSTRASAVHDESQLHTTHTFDSAIESSTYCNLNSKKIYKREKSSSMTMTMSQEKIEEMEEKSIQVISSEQLPPVSTTSSSSNKLKMKLKRRRRLSLKSLKKSGKGIKKILTSGFKAMGNSMIYATHAIPISYECPTSYVTKAAGGVGNGVEEWNNEYYEYEQDRKKYITFWNQALEKKYEEEEKYNMSRSRSYHHQHYNYNNNNHRGRGVETCHQFQL